MTKLTKLDTRPFTKKDFVSQAGKEVLMKHLIASNGPAPVTYEIVPIPSVQKLATFWKNLDHRAVSMVMVAHVARDKANDVATKLQYERMKAYRKKYPRPYKPPTS